MSEDRETRLAPVAEGHLLRSSRSWLARDLVPPRARSLFAITMFVPTAAFGLGSAFLVFRHGVYLFYAPTVLTKLLPVGVVGGAVVSRFFTRLVGWQLRRVAQVSLSMAALRGQPAGSLVRLVGTVGAAPSFKSAVSGRPAVLAHYLSVVKGKAPLNQVRGIDFVLEIPGGDSVLVSANEAFFSEPLSYKTRCPDDTEAVGRADLGPWKPYQEGKTLYREAIIAPGDSIEVIGVLDRRLDPAMSSGLARSSPLREVIRGAARLPLLIRKV